MSELDLDQFKSAKVISDPEEMLRHFTADGRGMAKSHVRMTGDGLFVVKRGAASTVAKPRAKTKAKGIATPNASEMQRLASMRGIDWEPGDESRTFAWWASDERVDSHGDIIRQDGWDFGQFAKNGPFLFGHRHGDMPIGRSISWDVKSRSEPDYNGDALWLLQYFARDDDFAGRVLRMVRSGILTSGSVGLRPTELVHIEDEAERKKLGLGRYGILITKASLLEFSVVPLPANDGATVIRQLEAALDAGGLKDADDVEILRELARIECADENPELWGAADAAFRGIGKTLFPNEQWKTHRDVEEPIISRGDGGMTFGAPTPTTLDKLAAELAAMRLMLGTVAADVAELKEDTAHLVKGCGGDGSKGAEKEEGPEPRSEDADSWNPYEDGGD